MDSSESPDAGNGFAIAGVEVDAALSPGPTSPAKPWPAVAMFTTPLTTLTAMAGLTGAVDPEPACAAGNGTLKAMAADALAAAANCLTELARYDAKQPYRE